MDKIKLPEDIKKELQNYREMYEKYLGEEKTKKTYSVRLTEKNIKIIKSKIKIPLSKILDEFLGGIAMAIQQPEKINSEGEKSDTEKEE